MKKTFGLALLVAGLASADTILTTPTAVSLGNVTNFSGVNLGLDKFDSSLGTLTGVKVFLSGDARLQFQILATATPISYYGNLGATGSLFLPGGITLIVQVNPSSPLGSAGSPIVQTNAEGLVTYNRTASDSKSANVAAGNFGLFQQAGGCTACLLLPLSGTNSTNVTVSGGFFSGSSAELDARAYIEYTYTPNTPSVPEPSSVALIGIGLVGMGMLARKSRKR